MTNFNNCNPINRFLWFFNPKIPLPSNHYTCGSNLAIFASLAQIESCLTGFSNNYKCLAANSPKLLRESKNDKENNSDNMGTPIYKM